MGSKFDREDHKIKDGDKGKVDSREIKPHQSHKTSANPDERACCNNDKCQLPAFHKANAETTHKGGEALQKNGNLIRDGIIDLVDITVKRRQTLLTPPTISSPFGPPARSKVIIGALTLTYEC